MNQKDRKGEQDRKDERGKDGDAGEKPAAGGDRRESGGADVPSPPL
jgi:hypothetical protein